MRRAVLALLVVAGVGAGYELGLRRNDSTVRPQAPRKAVEGGDSLDDERARRAVAPEERLAPALEAVLAIGNRAAPNRLSQYAALCTAVENLDSAEIVQLLVKLDRLPASTRDLLMPLIVCSWAQRDPDAATAWLQPTMARWQKQQNFMGMSYAYEQVVYYWAIATPKTAMEYARQHPDHPGLRLILGSAIDGISRSSTERLATLQSLPDSAARRSVETRIISDWAYSDPRAALAAASALDSGTQRDDAHRRVLLQWAKENPAEALAAMDSLGTSDSAFSSLVVNQAARRDPLAVARWLEAGGADAVSRNASGLLSAWACKDPAAAFAWGQNHGVSPADVVTLDRQSSTDQAFLWTGRSHTQIQVAMEQSPDATLKWLQSLPPGREYDQYAELAARVGRSPDDCRTLMLAASDDSAIRIAASFEARLAVENPERAQEWASSLTGRARVAAWSALGQKSGGKDLPDSLAGADRDAFLSGLANANTGQPQKGAEVALQISDPALRRQAFDDAMSRWSGSTKTDPAALRTWVEQAAVPEDWKQQWLAWVKVNSDPSAVSSP